MLSLRIDLLGGRYVATRYNDRRAAEWPPHPARVFSALVATHFEDAPDDPAPEREALRWLERQAPPALRASEASAREVVTVFVPVNDTSVVKDKRAVALEVEHDPSASRVQEATKLLPERRVRQPRTFPSVTPEDPVFELIWSAEAPPPVREALAGLARRVVRVGHSSSVVRCVVQDEAGTPTWEPDASGELTLRVPAAGQLERLSEAFALHQSTEPRVLPCAFQAYRRATQITDEAVVTGVFGEDWLVFRRVDGPRLPPCRAVSLARAVRGALMKYADQPAPPVISGHAAPGVPLRDEHLAIVPLPFVGHRHADGHLMGVALVMPRDLAVGERQQVLRAVGRWEAAHREEDEDTPRLPLTLGRAGVVGVERVAWGRPAHSLRSETWCGPARRWMSASPVALGRNPGELGSRDPKKAQAAYAEACALLSRDCEHIGLPRPVEVVLRPSVSLVGTQRVRDYPSFPPGRGKLKRVKVHAELCFDRPVTGPVLLGAGRFFGLGLFRPLGGDDAHA